MVVNADGSTEDATTGEDVAEDASTVTRLSDASATFYCDVFPADPFVLYPGAIAGDVVQQCSGSVTETYVSVSLQQKNIVKHGRDTWTSYATNIKSGYGAGTLTQETKFTCRQPINRTWRMIGTGQATNARGETYGLSVRSHEKYFQVCSA